MARTKKIGIYLVTSPTGRKYVGQSIDIQKRFWGYLAMTNIDRQVLLGRSFKKYGSDSHTFEIIEECEIDTLNERERHWQDYYNVTGKNGLNCILTRTSDKTPFLSPETRRKMSESAKIRMQNNMKDPLYIEKMKRAAKKRIGIKMPPRTEEQKLMFAEINRRNAKKGKDNHWYGVNRTGSENPFFGKKHTPESCDAISKKAKGRKASEETLKLYTEQRSLGGNSSAKLVMNIENGVFYDCGKEAWMSTGMNYAYSTFKSKLNGSNKYPLNFKYV